MNIDTALTWYIAPISATTLLCVDGLITMRIEVSTPRPMTGDKFVELLADRECKAAELCDFLNGCAEPAWVVDLRKYKNHLSLGSDIVIKVEEDLCIGELCDHAGEAAGEAMDRAPVWRRKLLKELAAPAKFDVARKAYRASSLYRGRVCVD